MYVTTKEIDFKPEHFHVNGDYLNVFFDLDSQTIIGCGDIVYDIQESRTVINIIFLEAYGNGKGRAIVDYLLHSNTDVIIYGQSLTESIGFWEKMGATFDLDKLNWVLHNKTIKQNLMTKHNQDFYASV